MNSCLTCPGLPRNYKRTGLRAALRPVIRGSPVFRILVFVHGGLNGYDASFEHMQQLMDYVEGSKGEAFNVIKGTCYYPLFIN
jgi:hypothetical protein